ncbi:uncharacterized protein K02A2.6-like [Harpegnathos saltator]|uniref:uncharacterized protein K02A2.6-like n=1 Tax=Harpegnathos saltator TaxID=610380 RepID=UPI00058C4C37|nr:uncharacterized protein K02A2.6-like [Harpegnathos saltator]
MSKWVEYRALRSANGKLIEAALDDLVISRWGTPHVLITDNGTEFVNKTIAAFAQKNNIEHSTVPPYHPQANPVERVNLILKTMIVAFLDRDYRDWDARLSDFRFAYNTAYHSSLGTSPAFINHGRELEPAKSLRRRAERNTAVEPGDPEQWLKRMKSYVPIHEWVRENLERVYQHQAQYYNLRRRPRTLRVGDLVFKRQHVLSSAAQNIAAKLVPKFHGPFKISKIRLPVLYEWERLDGSSAGKIHVQDLNPYVSSEPTK